MSKDSPSQEQSKGPDIRTFRRVFALGASDRDGLRLSQEVCADIVQAIDRLDRDDAAARNEP